MMLESPLAYGGFLSARSWVRTGSSSRLVLAALLALVLGVGAAALTVSSEHAELRAVGHPDSPVMELLIGWSFAAAGLVAMHRRPGNRFGLLLYAVGLAWFSSSLLAA